MDNFSKQIYEAGINDGRAEGKAESIKAGIEKAKELIASGAAMAKLEEFRQLSNQ